MLIEFVFWLYGLFIGSFLALCIWRLPQHLPVMWGRSACPACGHRLALRDLLPLVSWLGLGGRCRYCQAPISPYYPAMELATGLLYLGCCWRYGPSLSAVRYCAVLSVLLVIAGVDWQTLEIPDALNLLLFVLGLVGLPLDGRSAASVLLGLVLISVPFGLISLATGGGIGGGDVKLMAALGLILGPAQVTLAAFIGCVSAALYALALLAMHKAHRRSYIALGPFLALGCAVAIYWGQPLLEWYLGLL